VTAIAKRGATVEVATNEPADRVLRAHCVVVATPLRVAAGSIDWSPALDEELAAAMRATPTWMAAQAKAVAVYDRSFWRDDGLSGRIASRVGPLVEAHDHSGPDGSPAAIFGFVGWPWDARKDLGAQLEQQIVEQLVRCLGPEARHPIRLHVEDWAANEFVCTALDVRGPPSHPEVTPGVLRRPCGDGSIFFAVAETAARSPGLIEGAFDAAWTTANQVLESFDGRTGTGASSARFPSRQS